MKIVSFDEFIKMPEGTIFSYYETEIVSYLLRKGKSINDTDYFEQSIVGDIWDDKMSVGEMTRWGLFHYKQQYVIYDWNDIKVMINLLAGITDVEMQQIQSMRRLAAIPRETREIEG